MAGRAALLDLDNTLVDRDAAVRAWLQDADLASAIVLPEPLPDELEPWLGAELAARMREQLPRSIEPDPRVLAALDRLAAAGWRLSLVSDGGGETQRRKLAAAGIDVARFDAVLISGEIGLAKPDARVFERARAMLGLAPDEVVMIGDSPTRDIAGARAVGLRTCWISRGRTWPDTEPPPDLRAADFVDAVAQVLGEPLG